MRPSLVPTLLLATLLFAANSQALDLYRFGSKIVEVGDTASKLIELAGEPVYKEYIQNEQGAVAGERWQFSSDGRTLIVVIKDGKIASIDQPSN